MSIYVLKIYVSLDDNIREFQLMASSDGILQAYGKCIDRVVHKSWMCQNQLGLVEDGFPNWRNSFHLVQTLPYCDVIPVYNPESCHIHVVVFEVFQIKAGFKMSKLINIEQFHSLLSININYI